MSTSTAELTLILRAQNLASGAIEAVHTSVDGLSGRIKSFANEWGDSFRSMARQIGPGLGYVAQEFARNGDLPQAAATLAIITAGAFIDTVGVQLVQKLAASAFVQGIAATLGTLGASIGSLISAAIPIGMAAAPYLLAAALIAAVAFLVTHPEVAGKALEVGASIVVNVVRGLVGLVTGILGTFVQAFNSVNTALNTFIAGVVGFFLSIPGQLVNLGGQIVTTIVGGLASLPGKVADVVRQAFANLKIDVGPFHISAAGVKIDLPTIQTGQNPYDKNLNYTPHASGGWVGLHGPELGLLGEKGPEYVIPNDQLRRGSPSLPGVRIVGVSEQDILDMVDQGLYFRLRRAGTGAL